jgi:hypothetical protein
MSRRCVPLALALCLVFAGSAGAAIPTGNLLANPGAEDGQASSNGTDVFRPPGWDMSARAQTTAVVYGAPGFLTAAQGVSLAGGRSFFAGGPPEEPDSSGWVMAQDVSLPADVRQEVATGVVQATVGGCLGGFGDQDDHIEVNASVSGSNFPQQFLFDTFKGPDAKARNNRTDLLPRSITAVLPAKTEKITVDITFQRTSGSYNDAYADNLSLILSPAGSTPPAPNCTGTTPTPPAPAPGPGPGPAPAPAPGPLPLTPPGGPAVTPFLISKGSGGATVRSGRVGVSLTCGAHDTACTGNLRLTVPRLARGSSVTLGSKAFTIAAGRTATVNVSLGRRAKARVNRLSARQLRRLRVTATVTMGGVSSRFTLRLRRA